VVLVAVLGLTASPAVGEVYRYVDDNGVPHFSDSVGSIPSRYRSQVVDISEELEVKPGINVIPGLDQSATGSEGGTDAGLEPDGGGGLAKSFDFGVGDEKAMAAVAEQMWSRFGALLLLGLLLFIPIALLIGAFILTLACKLAASETLGLGRACAVVFVQGLVGTAVNAVVAGAALGLGLFASGEGAAVGLNVVSLLALLAAYAGVLSSMTGLAFARALWVTIVCWILSLVMVGIPVVIVMFLVVL
jgi:hypothetical protein